MSLRVAVQMDPLEHININGDSSFHLMLAAQARGHELWHYDVATLAYDTLDGAGGRITAWAVAMRAAAGIVGDVGKKKRRFRLVAVEVLHHPDRVLDRRQLHLARVPRDSVRHQVDGEVRGLDDRRFVGGRKPTQCRAFPYWPELLESKATWTSVGKYCPGIGKGPLIQIKTAKRRAQVMRKAYPEMYSSDACGAD